MIDLPLIDLTQPVRRNAALARGLVTWWLSLPGLDGGLRLHDLMGPRHGVLTLGSPANAWPSARPRPGGLASAVYFPNSITRIKGPTAPLAATNPYSIVRTGGDFTAGLWVRVDARASTVGTVLLVNDDAANGTGCVFYAGPGTNAWRVYVRGVASDLAGAMPADGTWRHFAITHKANSVQRYVNGIAAGAPIGLSGTFSASTDTIVSGNYIAGFATYQLTGAVDDVRFYSRALSAIEVRDWYDDSLRGCPALLRRVPLFTWPTAEVVVPALPVVPVVPLRMASRRTRELAARAPRPWDGVASNDRVIDLFARS